MPKTTLPNGFNTQENTVYIALELSDAKWVLCMTTGEKFRTRSIPARDFEQLRIEVEEVARLNSIPIAALKVVSCYEAGRDGFYIHRKLEKMGWQNKVVDSASIEVNRRKRRAKNDRIDAESLLRQLLRHCAGEKKAFSVVRIPTVEQEDMRRQVREIDRLRVEMGSHTVRIKSLLLLNGVIKIDPASRGFLAELSDWRVQLEKEGFPLPPHVLDEVIREYARRQLVRSQRQELCTKLEQQLAAEVESSHVDPTKPPQPGASAMQKVARLAWLRGIGMHGAWVLVTELFGWRKFDNPRQLAALVGLVPSPYSSGTTDHEQGISKAGRAHLRRLLTQLAWGWLRLQPNSKLSQWFNERFATGKRSRRCGITAMSRKLLIALWRHVEQGIVPEGATLKTRLLISFGEQ